ncbi:MAG: LysR family transcriptional regulator [Rhodospirillales bacterium]|nr:LysR family transcriptional regulator [Rhodospirillales bacterium]
MDIPQLRYFVQIVESGSLSKASKQLYVAQPALSQQLAKLEAKVGKSLLTRSSKGVKPTDNGLALYYHAKYMLRQLEQTMSIARNDAGALQGMVSVGLPATTVAAVGLALVKSIRAKYPGILLNVVEGMSGHIGQMIRFGQLDIAVQFSSDIAPELIVEPLMDEELFVIIPKNSKLVAKEKESITIAEAAVLPMILPTSGHGLRQRISTAFLNRGLTPNVVAEIDSLSLLMNCVSDGIGATIKPMGAVMQDTVHGRKWRCLAVSDVRLRRANFICMLPQERLSAASSIVATELRYAVQNLISENKWRGFANPTLSVPLETKEKVSS